MNRPRAFTLIELLIVVAIIAILAAIAIPNLIAARTRALVTRAIADHASISKGIEGYRVDWDRLPEYQAIGFSQARGFPRGYSVLTTPTAYMGSNAQTFFDPFGGFNINQNWRDDWFYEASYGNRRGTGRGGGVRDSYMLESIGPDGLDSIITAGWGRDTPSRMFIPYDPTNGTVSFGDIYRVGGRLPAWFVASGLPMVNPLGR